MSAYPIFGFFRLFAKPAKNFLLICGTFFKLSALFLFCELAPPVWAQQPVAVSNEWTHLDSPPREKSGAERWVAPFRAEFFQLEHARIRAKYSGIQRGQSYEAGLSGSEIFLPMPDGGTARFKIVEAPVMEAGLAAKFPDVKTYAGVGLDDTNAAVRLDLTPAGFHAQVLSPHGAFYVDPAYRRDTNYYVSYYRRDYQKTNEGFQCLSQENQSLASAMTSPLATANVIESGATLRTYRLALACTAEYAAYFGGTASGAMSAMVTAVNRVNGIYETELAVQMVLIANDELLVYTNASTEPYSNGLGSVMLTQNQSNIDAVIGTANYDYGHVFSTGGGGIAYVGVVCSASSKAGGVTGIAQPVGDPFYIDYVAHEMGHQFGAHHPFNSNTGSCGGVNRYGPTAVEPGGGSTIMAYAGICAPNNLQAVSDSYFNGANIDEIQAYIAGTGGSCAVNSATGNSAPTVSAGASYTIPSQTPFVLTATGSDPNGDTLSYCWEEMDLGPATALTDPDNGSSPLFRSLSPTNVPMRYFPNLASVLAHTNWDEEILPTNSRTMTFRVTARDNRTGGGGVSYSQTQITVVSNGAAFAVTAPKAGVSLSGTTIVSWNVAGTASAPINATGVNISLSVDGGQTYPFALASNAANNGAKAVTLPSLATSAARIKVQGTGNIFFNVSPGNFTITPSGGYPQVVSTALVSESFKPTNGAIDPYETVSVNWGVKNVGPTSTTNLVGTLLQTNGIYYPGGPQTYGAIPAGATVTRAFTFTPSGVCGGTVAAVMQLADGAAPMGIFTNVFILGTNIQYVSTQTYSNIGTMTIPASGKASPFPCTIPVTGITNPVVKVTVTLNGYSHTRPDDVGIMVAGPGGQTVGLMDGCGGTTAVTNLTLAFSDSAAAELPKSSTGTALTSGTWLPSNYNPSDSYSAPAPSPPFGTNITALGATPNGTWSLYCNDFSAPYGGSISGGWSLTIVSSNSVPLCETGYPTPDITGPVCSPNVVWLTWSSIPGPHYQVQYTTNVVSGYWSNLGAAILATNVWTSTTDTAVSFPAKYYRVVVGQ
jgi:hypothetical protein